MASFFVISIIVASLLVAGDELLLKSGGVKVDMEDPSLT